MHSCITATNTYLLLPSNVESCIKENCLIHAMKAVQLHSFLTLATKWRCVVNSTPQPLYPQGRIYVPFVPQTSQRREKLHVSTCV